MSNVPAALAYVQNESVANYTPFCESLGFTLNGSINAMLACKGPSVVNYALMSSTGATGTISVAMGKAATNIGTVSYTPIQTNSIILICGVPDGTGNDAYLGGLIAVQRTGAAQPLLKNGATANPVSMILGVETALTAGTTYTWALQYGDFSGSGGSAYAYYMQMLVVEIF